MNVSSSRLILLVGLLLSLPSQVPAQQPAPQAEQKQAQPAQPAETPVSTAPTIAVDARLVNLPVVVRDKKGALIQNLTKNDFTLQVDGHTQTIRYFDKDTNLPLILVLHVDTSPASVMSSRRSASASSIFLDQTLSTPKKIRLLLFNPSPTGSESPAGPHLFPAKATGSAQGTRYPGLQLRFWLWLLERSQ